MNTTKSNSEKGSKEIIDEFFYSFHPVEVEEYLREISAILDNRDIKITEREIEEYSYFFARLTELIKASYLLRS